MKYENIKIFGRQYDFNKHKAWSNVAKCTAAVLNQYNNDCKHVMEFMIELQSKKQEKFICEHNVIIITIIWYVMSWHSIHLCQHTNNMLRTCAADKDSC